jgi:hypothetical protein
LLLVLQTEEQDSSVGILLSPFRSKNFRAYKSFRKDLQKSPKFREKLPSGCDIAAKIEIIPKTKVEKPYQYTEYTLAASV